MGGICLVGAGHIARVHADVLRDLNLRIACVVDPNEAAAKSISAGAPTHASLEAALEAGGFQRAHVLTPPDTHAGLAQTLLHAGVHVLTEKPIATSVPDAAGLTVVAEENNAFLGVNQNFVHHPAFARLLRQVGSGDLGPVRFVSCIYHAPLRQLASGQFSHWMFRASGNILLEQSVHPLSQLCALGGVPLDVQAIAEPAIKIGPGIDFVRAFSATLKFAEFAAQFRQMLGAEFPFWQITVACDDGVAVADMMADRFVTHGRTSLLEATDFAASGLRTAAQMARASAGNFIDYGKSQIGLGGRRDSFYVGMRESIAAFHESVDAGRAPRLDGRFGTMLVQICETIRDRAFPQPRELQAPVVRTQTTPDVVLIGGTGFIGTHTVRRLTDMGRTVTVMARHVDGLSTVFDRPNVRLFQGDIANAQAVAAAIGDTPLVVNLAHGGGGEDYAAIERRMVGGVRSIAAVCLEKRVARFVQIGSIAALYLGDPNETVTGATPPDPKGDERADYARAKALADRRLLTMHTEKNLPLVLLRPGLVVGEGSSPFHTGLGMFNNHQHCIGWNAGLNPLPFVLADDVADAIALALQADNVDGRTYNLVGDVRLTARDYITTLARALRRPLRYHPQTPRRLWLEDIGKWSVKQLGGRKVPGPSLRDFQSRGMTARFDCRDVAADLGWRPVAEREEFLAGAIDIHVP